MESLITLAVAATIGLSATFAIAGPVYTFSVSQGTQPSNVGIITLTQVDADSVQIGVDLLNGYGFVNTGGPHTPLAFNLTGSGALSISPFTTPAGGVYASGVFSLNISGGDNTPYGTFGIALDSSAHNGSGNGYFGDLLFTLNRAGGLDTNNFARNADNDPIVGGSFFSADLSNGTNTGAQAWAEGVDPPTQIPLPSTLALLGLAFAGLGFGRRKQAYPFGVALRKVQL